MSIELKNLKKSAVCHLKTNCSISLKLTVFIADTHRCLHVNFLSNWLSVKIAENFIKLSKQRCVCVLWTPRNTMHLEFLKNIKFKVGNERPLVSLMYYSLHFSTFIVRYCSLANSGQLSYVGLHLVGLCLVGLHLVGSSLTSCSAH